MEERQVQVEREDKQKETEAWAQDVLPMVLNHRGDSGTEVGT